MVRETEISTQFGFQIYEIIPMKGVYLIKTDKGNKCLKKIAYGTQKLMYIYKAKEHIVSNGFDKIDRNYLTPEGTPFAFVNDDIYVVTNWIEGKECDFKKEEDLKRAAETLGSFHLCARGFTPDEDTKVRSDIGKLTNTLDKRLATLNKMRDIARKNKRKTEFDMLYLTNVEFYLKLSKEAMKALDLESYKKVCSDALSDKVLCHHDFTYHNILFADNGDSYVIDFDYCKWEMQIYDVATLLIKSLKRLNWDINSGKLVLEAYSNIKPITKYELNILKTLLVFPQRFWRLSNRYYYKEAGWSEASFVKKMREIIDEREVYMNFISSL